MSDAERGQGSRGTLQARTLGSRDWPLERAGQDRGAAGIRKRTFIRVGLDVPTKGALFSVDIF